MKCIKCGAENWYDIVDKGKSKFSGHIIRCKRCSEEMFLATNGSVYNIQKNSRGKYNNINTDYFQEEIILNNRNK